MELEYGEKVKLDSKDRKILEQMQKNCRQTIAEIAKNTKLPRDVVVYRIKKLEQLKVIRAHHTLLNPQRLGYPLYVYVLFSCYNLNPEDEIKLVNYLKSYKKIIYVAKNSGEFDFTIGVCSKDYKEFDETVREIRQKFPDTIKDIKVTPVIQEYKYDWMVDLISIDKRGKNEKN
ncbi:Lrp/AsnC family transcriptional regulator [Candidatus Pacearchaeota archaeon]|nr:Lrp/AsnC family transcriptional regulator [Candidatus Pacearchaeota archaeon]